ncbi:hypothetical protein [Bradyrhizobium sp. 27S5]|uniref:hypothetical protein n=1 Tax=Bradyrhizobium sp. 27S5 TaxID=3139728 RepID=UPI0030D269A8
MSDKASEFPIERAFLELTQELADASSERTDQFFAEAGKSLPKTVDATGTVLSILYRLACCYYGCRGGDHQIEWLTGKFVSQAISAYRLVRAAQYDEALMLIRGMGEIANLLWLFYEDRTELATWKVADKKARLNNFRPSAVRRRLESLNQLGPPIDAERYAALCEIGTHPTPALAPGHYSGTGQPVLGAILQEVGVFVCVNELAYTVAMAAIPIVVLLNASDDVKAASKNESVRLLEGIGNFTVLNYEEGLREVMARATSTSKPNHGAS